jgi:hypothetical protein
MNPDWVNDLIAVVALVLSAFSVAFTLNHTKRTLRVTTYQGATALALDADRMLLQYPQLRPYIYLDKEPPPEGEGEDEDEYHRVMAGAEFFLDVVECIWDHRKEYSRVDQAAWREFIHELLAHSPVMRDTFRGQPDWYPALQHLIELGTCTSPDDHETVHATLRSPHPPR